MSEHLIKYRKKLTTPADAVERIRNGEIIVCSPSFSQPPALLEALAAKIKKDNLEGLRLFSFQSSEHAVKTILDPTLAHAIQQNSWHVSESDRGLIQSGISYYVPAYLRQISHFCEEHTSIDYVMATVSPMDKSGYFSFGLGDSYMASLSRLSHRLIVEVNDQMPRVFGAASIHVSEVGAIVENNCPLLEIPITPARDEDELIGPRIAELIPDGATLQMSLDPLTQALCRFLGNHKDLGIHTDTLSPGLTQLIKKGVITGANKSIHRYQHVFTMAAGNKEMYDFMNDNPSVTSFPASYTCAPSVIASQEKMISINHVLEVDLLGQANAEHLEGTTCFGAGSCLDFVRGAAESKGGKSILALYSTADGGNISRIVPSFREGTAVTIPRADVQHIVTEFGAVNLSGKSTRERALAIINLAHPRFREDLMKAAENMYLI